MKLGADIEERIERVKDKSGSYFKNDPINGK